MIAARPPEAGSSPSPGGSRIGDDYDMAVTARGRPGSTPSAIARPSRVPRRGARLSTALSRRRLDELLRRVRGLRIAVVGDFFLDAYYDCDRHLDEASLETGSTCYQVVRTRRQAGAAGAVAANLAALGAGSVHAVGFCGEDGEGWELRRALEGLGLETAGFLTVARRRTPTYGKLCCVRRDGGRLVLGGELQRLDIRNRRRTPKAVLDRLIGYLRGAGEWDALVAVDQVPEAGCGVITSRMRSCLEDLARRRPEMVVLADSRRRIHRFGRLPIKPNHHEAAAALGLPEARSIGAAATQARRLAARRRPVFLTLAERGLVVAVPEGPVHHVSGFPVPGIPVDPVGAGDSSTAALASCLAAGASPVEAALVANLAGSITVQQIGTTGTATPAQIRRRWREVDEGEDSPGPGR